MRQMILRGPDIHPGVNYVVRGDNRRIRINERSRLINAGFRCHNPECEQETTQRFDLNGLASTKLPSRTRSKPIRKERRRHGRIHIFGE